MNRNFTRSGTIQITSNATMMVSTMLNGVDSKFSRSQPSAPVIEAGGGCCSSCAFRTNAISVTARSPSDMVMASSLHQSHAAIVDAHQERGDQADGQINQHGDGHDLDCMAG